MPHFYSHQHEKVFGKITVTPKPWWRNFIRLGDYSIFPYFVMGTIEFTVEFEKLPEPSNSPFKYTICEKLGDGSYQNILTIEHNKVQVKGLAECTGDTKFFISRSNRPIEGSEQLGKTLFFDNILSLNTYVFGIGGIVISAVLSCIVGIILSLVVFRPFWEIWIPTN